MTKYWRFFIYRLRVSISGEKNKINIYTLKVYKNTL
ncbi:hypothetical protein EQ807_10715 [Staphylococcus epidermidis]|nr:hypothetical protein EQ807_10715 [Staphylococcus epidermidis]TBW82928.1 hypothetical protein EQ805_10680 [Staphylococcus epidermidis]